MYNDSGTCKIDYVRALQTACFTDGALPFLDVLVTKHLTTGNLLAFPLEFIGNQRLPANTPGGILSVPVSRKST